VYEVAGRTAQGKREHMEDFVRVVQPFGGSDGLYAAVFDGHGGEDVSRRGSDRLHEILAALWESEPAVDALTSAFKAFDGEVADEKGGSVATVSVLQGEWLSVANVGDCHALVVSESAQEIVTQGHRLTNQEEYDRVVAAGAKIRAPYMCLPGGRGLMTTRSFGDAAFKQIGNIAEPAIATRAMGPGDHWLILGSDGVWDFLAAEDVAAIVRPASSATVAADQLLDAVLPVSDDNVSVVIIRLG